MKTSFQSLLKEELDRIDEVKITKRKETVIERFEKKEGAPKAIINGKPVAIFNSNDYLGLRHHAEVKKAEEEASLKYGAGPGAVRFISGTLKIHTELEAALAKFHHKEGGMIFSSAFAANQGVIFPLIVGQSKDSKVHGNTLVISDQLNHRSIIDAIRLAKLPKEQKPIFEHLNIDNLDEVLEQNKGRFRRVLVITDGIFSMLGEYQNVKQMNDIVAKHQDKYGEGILTILDDSHGVASFGKTGRGVEEYCHSSCDLVVGTMGKGFGVDGGYVVGPTLIIDYLRESAATYIYSNPISPGTAGAALKSVQIVNSKEGKKLLDTLNKNIEYFKQKIKEAGFRFACDSQHAIQPILIGNPVKTRELVDALFKKGFLVTNISYPIVPKGKDEIRVQLSAAHTAQDLDEFIQKTAEVGKKLGLI